MYIKFFIFQIWYILIFYTSFSGTNQGIVLAEMSSMEILNLLEKASTLLNNGNVSLFRNNFSEIKKVIKSIPGHEDLVNINSLDTLEDWQLKELQSTLIEQLKKTKMTWQNLKKTGVDN